MRWAEAHEKIARMTLTIKLDRNWSSFQLANSAPPLSVTDSAIAPSARMDRFALRLLSCSWQVAPRCLETRSRQRDARRSDDATNQGSRKTSKVTQRVCCPRRRAMPVQHARVLEQARSKNSPRGKIHVTSKSPVGDISVVTLIRTDTTLDHSQKAEKVWSSLLEIMVSQLAKAPRRWLEMLRIELARVASSLAASRPCCIRA